MTGPGHGPRFDLALINGRLVVPEQGEVRATVGVLAGRVAALLDAGSVPAAGEVIDVGGKVVFPGVIDAHTHVTLGPPDGWFTETRAAAVAGIATVIDYQLTSKSYVETYPEVRAVADRRACVDYGLHFCPSVEAHLEELDAWVRELGVSSFKFYMNFRGDEGGTSASRAPTTAISGTSRNGWRDIRAPCSACTPRTSRSRSASSRG